MNIAFYAPMKPPDAAVPSGDVAIARGLIAALEIAGHRVEVAARLRTWQAAPDPVRQQRLAEVGRRMARRLVRRFAARREDRRPDLWFTYHLYYKAPDWLGPEVSTMLNIPYVVAEASHAPKRAGGAWDVGHRAAEAAIRRADRVFGLNSADAGCVTPLLGDPSKLIRLKPFMDMPEIPGEESKDETRRFIGERYGADPGAAWLIAVAMMRDDAKLASYRVLADAFARLNARNAVLFIVGDGPARGEVEKAFAAKPQYRFHRRRVIFTGQLDRQEVARLLDAADLYVWPAVNEAYGMALLEAQAHGLPTVAGGAGGVADIVRDGVTGLLTPEGDAAALTRAIDALLDDPARRKELGRTARVVAGTDHSLTAAAAILDGALREVVS